MISPLFDKISALPRNYRIILGIGLFVIGWFSVGTLLMPSKKSDIKRRPEETDLMRVEVMPLQAQEKDMVVEVVAYTEASRSTKISAEIEGIVIQEFAKKGDVVQKGAPLLEISAEDRAQQYTRAEAALEYHKHHYKASVHLSEKGFRTPVALADAKAQLKKAEADFIKAQQDLGHTKILAPFAGVVEKYEVEVGTFVSRGMIVGSIVQLDPLMAVAYFSQYEYERVQVGQKVWLELSTGLKLEGVITYLAPVADSKTRTFKIEASFPNAQNKIPGGLSAKLLIPSQKVKAHKIPAHVLSLSDQGETGVKIMDEDQVVRFLPIKVLESTVQDLWVSGLPEKGTLIVSGQDFIKPGEKVLPTPMAQLSHPAP